MENNENKSLTSYYNDFKVWWDKQSTDYQIAGTIVFGIFMAWLF